jgi:hypothetical protein
VDDAGDNLLIRGCPHPYGPVQSSTVNSDEHRNARRWTRHYGDGSTPTIGRRFLPPVKTPRDRLCVRAVA